MAVERSRSSGVPRNEDSGESSRRTEGQGEKDRSGEGVGEGGTRIGDEEGGHEDRPSIHSGFDTALVRTRRLRAAEDSYLYPFSPAAARS
jgi:hypothetical protein